jgi:hypothetical protein
MILNYDSVEFISPGAYGDWFLSEHFVFKF